MSEVWLTLPDLCAVKLPSLPCNYSSLQRHIVASDWRALGPELARKRKVRGGGWEYNLKCLPEEAQRAYLAQLKKSEVAQPVEAAPEDVSQNAKRIAERRVSICQEIQRRSYTAGSAGAAITSLLADARAGLLADELALALRSASARQRSAAPSRSTLFNWLKTYSKEGFGGLVPQTDAKVPEILETYPFLRQFMRYWASPSKPTIAHALELMKDDMLSNAVAPSYRQVTRAIKALKASDNHLDAYKGREGPLALKARLGFVSRKVDGIDPGTVYTSDGKTFAAEVQHPRHHQPFRPEITTVLDITTRKIVGWSVGLDENAELVADALRHACEQNGICAIFYTDRGPGYKNQRLGAESGLCARLGITITHSLPYNSQARGQIERPNETIWNRLAKEYPSYIGKDMDRQAAKEFFRRSRKELALIESRKQSSLGPLSKLLVSWEQFLEDVGKAVDDYNNRPHGGLRFKDPETGRKRKYSPNEAWKLFEDQGLQVFRIEPGESDDLFRPYVNRKTNRGLVSWKGNSYFSNNLEKYHGQDVLVGYDIHDGSKVWVREVDYVDGAECPGKLICVATFEGNAARYFPVSVEQQAIEQRAKARARRLEKKLDEVEAEARPQIMATVTPLVQDVLPPSAEDKEPVVAQPLPFKPRFNDDFDLAEFCISNPEQMTDGQRRLLLDLYNSPSSQELLILRNIEPDDLRSLLQSTDSTKTQANGEGGS